MVYTTINLSCGNGKKNVRNRTNVQWILCFADCRWMVRIYMKFPNMWDVKIEKNIYQRKIITHKTVFTWFGNLLTFTKLQEFHYSQKKKKRCGSSIFLSQKQYKTLISKTAVFISTQLSKPLLHGLSFRKSLIKNRNNIISGWVIIWIKHN